MNSTKEMEIQALTKTLFNLIINNAWPDLIMNGKRFISSLRRLVIDLISQQREVNE